MCIYEKVPTSLFKSHTEKASRILTIYSHDFHTKRTFTGWVILRFSPFHILQEETSVIPVVIIIRRDRVLMVCVCSPHSSFLGLFTAT